MLAREAPSQSDIGMETVFPSRADTLGRGAR
jgi:hypothetical protein